MPTGISLKNAHRHFSNFALQRTEKGKKIDAKHRSMDAFNWRDHRSNTTFILFFNFEEQGYFALRSWRYGVNFRLENAGDGRSLFLLGAYFGSFSWVVVFWNAFENILKRRDWEGRGRSGGVIEIFRGMDKKAFFSFFERHCPGERWIRYFYALGGYRGVVGNSCWKKGDTILWLKEQTKTLRNLSNNE